MLKELLALQGQIKEIYEFKMYKTVPIICTNFTINCTNFQARYCVKSVHIRSFSGPYFPAFGLEKFRIRTLFTQCAYLLKFRNEFQQISACYGLSTTTSAIRYVHVLYLIVLCHFKEFRNHSDILFSCPRA